MSRLVIVSKSPASPPIRREHALARLASEHGIDVVFIERARDVRSARRDPLGWLRALVRPRGHRGSWGRVVSPSIVVPGHRGSIAAGAAALLMGRVLRAESRPGDVVCVMTPWDWLAAENLPGVRRVFDCADDWPTLISARGKQLKALNARAGGSAEQVVVASPKLAAAFAPRRVGLVRNGASQECLASPTSPRPRAGRAVYVGTLSERVDTELLGAVLDLLPDLEVGLFGPCAYAGSGASPSPELAELLARRADRIVWHGVLDRAAVPAAIDGADVGLLPFHPELARGDIMKVYDYAARGRPIVSTAGVVDSDLGGVPGMIEAASTSEFAIAIGKALSMPTVTLVEARRWAEENDWESRWLTWRELLFGGGEIG